MPTSPASVVAPRPFTSEDVAPPHEDLTEAYLLQHRILPLRAREPGVLLGTWGNRPDRLILDRVALLLGAPVRLVPIEEAPGVAEVRSAYGREARTADALIDALDTVGGADKAEPRIDDLVSQAHEAPVIRLVNMLLLEAIEARASDVHIEQSRDRTDVRYRIDGVLVPAPSPPRELSAAIVSRLKIMAHLDIAEHRLPQDGRISLQLRGRQLDLRVSTLPSLHGESVVLRILGADATRLGIGALGMPDALREQYLAAARQTNGIVLVTGPTGSGKTTTLYATIDAIRSGSEKILTVEDPVEYELDGAVQLSIRPKIGLTFASALRALLRQDPDIILVGEIRDVETARIAIHAALTGHLVFSTLHTNDAAGALTRLVDLGIEPFLVASTVRAVLAQRLLRMTCGDCTETTAPTDAEAAWLGCASNGAGDSVKRGAGCNQCRGTGYRGRTGVYELLKLNAAAASRFSRFADSTEVLEHALGAGFVPLRHAARHLVSSGRISPAEAMRVVG